MQAISLSELPGN